MTYEEAIAYITPDLKSDSSILSGKDLREAVKAIKEKVEGLEERIDDLQYQIGDLQEELDNTL